MPTPIRHLLVTMTLLAIAAPAQSQNWTDLTVTGQLRQRSELDARDFNSNTTPGGVHLLRTRLNAAFQPTPRVQVFAQIQDSRRFGEGDPDRARGTMDPTAGQLDLHQAYFRVDRLFGMPLSLTVGRQELAYGNQRLVGTVEWSNVGRTFDGTRLSLSGERGSIDLFAARLVERVGEGEGAQNFVGLYGTWKVADQHELDMFTLFDNDTQKVSISGDERTNRLNRLTPGMALRGGWSRFSYQLEAAYQLGKQAISPGESRSAIGAYLLSVHSGYDLIPRHDIILSGGYTRLSGDDAPGDGDLGQFNTLFATNHAFYGSMDFFPVRAAPFGLQDTHVNVSAGISEQVRVSATFHHFTQTKATATQSARTLGQELDLTLTYQFADVVTFSGGLSGFIPDDAMEQAVGSNDRAYWAYVMSTIHF